VRYCKGQAMIIKSKGIIKENLFIPPFELNEGELIVLHLYGGGHYNALKNYLQGIFTGKLKNENVIIYKPLAFVDYIYEPKLRRLFYPMTVGEYLKKHAKPNSEYATKIYETNDWITKKTRLNTLFGTSRKLLSLFAKLSNSKDILFDLDGQDPLGAIDMYEFVKQNVKNGGSGILLDWTDELRNDCTKFIQLEQIK
jgi:hypothetical protein